MHGANTTVLAGRRVARLGFRHILPLGSGDSFTAGEPGEAAESIRLRLARLAQKIAATPEPNKHNDRIPSGYTYLLQLIAHDLVQSSVSLSGFASFAAATSGTQQGNAGVEYALQNTRNAMLGLETIYGGGPDTCPHAYAHSFAAQSTTGHVPRTRLRLGRLRNMPCPADPSRAVNGPYLDIGRAVPADVADDGLRPEPDAPQERALDSTAAGAVRAGRANGDWLDLLYRSEPLVADPRNDDHALISQLTVLFHILHNAIITLLEGQRAREDLLVPTDAYNRFLCARMIVMMIYHAIVRRDVLPRILHPAVQALYAGPRPPKAPCTPDGDGEGIALEFTHAAFRFGHAMVRDAYLVNSHVALQTSESLAQSARRFPGGVPVNTSWRVDWARFFPTDGQHNPSANYSRRIGPNYPTALRDRSFGASREPDAVYAGGLIERDLLSAAEARLWKVPNLCEKLRDNGFKDVLPAFDEWRQPLHDWLGAADDPDMAKFVDDPPLTFFVLFEAARIGRPDHAEAGRHLGPLGSIIVADAIIGALNRCPLPTPPGATWSDQLDWVCSQLNQPKKTLAPLVDGAQATRALQASTAGDVAGGITSMAQLIAVMHALGALPQ